MLSNRTRMHILAAAAVLLTLGGCDDRLPTGPSDLTRGAVIYEHANFLGESAQIDEDIRDLEDFRGPCERYDTSGTGSTTIEHTWDDCISSIRVAPGWRATIYRHDHFDGESLDVDSDVANLQLVAGTCDHDGLNDCVSSIRIVRP